MPQLVKMATLDCVGRMGLVAPEKAEEGISDTRAMGAQSV